MADSEEDSHLWDNLIELHQCYVLAKALPTPVAKDELECTLHAAQLIFGGLQPPLRPKLFGVVAPNILFAKDAPGAVADVGALRQVMAFKGVATLGNFLGHEAGDRGVNTETFLDDSLKVRHGTSLTITDDGPRKAIPADLRSYLLKNTGIGDDIENGRSDGGGGRVGASQT